MKAVFVLLCVAVASGQRFRGGFRGGFGGSFRGSSGRGFSNQPASSNAGGAVDATNGGSEYHYSWLHDNRRKYPHGQAVSYCNRLSGNWAPISIEDGAENSFVTNVISRERQEYIWTGGSKSGGGFIWHTGAPVSYNNWSSTGGNRVPQPDNRERGGENCLAILNNFYRDGITWHDVACHHRKPIICERKV